MKRSTRERKRRSRARRQDRLAFADAAREEARNGVFGRRPPLTFEDVMAWGMGDR